MSDFQIDQSEIFANISSSFQCIVPSREELNYETSQVQCPHKTKNQSSEKCQKLFKNIMALNVHLQMYHKETGITTPSNKYTSRIGRYHCPVEECIFHCRCDKNSTQSMSFSNFNAVRLHYLRQHGVKKEQCQKCSKSFGLHQDFIAHDKICGIDCPFSCTVCYQQFHNRTSLRRHQLKYHSNINNQPDSDKTNVTKINFSTKKMNERQKRTNSRCSIPREHTTLSRQNSNSHQSVTINPRALELIKNFNLESTSVSSTTSITDAVDFWQSESDKATQTNTTVSVGTECCSLASNDFSSQSIIQKKTTQQKSSQTQGRIRIFKNQTQSSTTTTTTDDIPNSFTFHSMPTNVFNASTMTQWSNLPNNNIESQTPSSTRSDMCIQTIASIQNQIEPSETNNSVIIQTTPISVTSTQMQTMSEYPLVSTTNHYNSSLLPYQESVGTSCFLDEFFLDDLTKTNSSTSVLFDFDAMDLLDLIDNGTQTYPLIASHETQTIPNWDTMLLNEDEWI